MRLSAQQCQKAIEYLRSKCQLRLLILFGSYATGHATEKSDVDLAFLSDEVLDTREIWLELSQELATLLGVESVDLVDLKKIDTVFRFVIVSTGKIIYQEGSVDEYLTLVYTMYLQLNNDRKEILAHYPEMVLNRSRKS